MRSKVPYTLFLTSNTQLVRRCPSQGLFCTNYWPNLVAICYLATQLPDGRVKREPPSSQAILSFLLKRRGVYYKVKLLDAQCSQKCVHFMVSIVKECRYTSIAFE